MIINQRSPASSFARQKTANRSRNSNSNNNNKLVLKGFLDGLFGGDDKGEIDKTDGAVLETYEIPNKTDSESIDVRFESLSDYITKKWIDLFETGTISLTTPIRVSKTFDSNNEDCGDDPKEQPNVTIEEAAGCRLLFQKIDTGYKSKNEEKTTNNTDGNKSNGNSGASKKKKKGTKQGGVEIVVQKYYTAEQTTPCLRVVARRCEIDEDTMIKEMSEEIILTELAKAIDVWKKERV